MDMNGNENENEKKRRERKRDIYETSQRSGVRAGKGECKHVD